MQDIIAYVCAAETLGSFRDVYGVKEVAAPTLIRGGEYCLRLRLFAESGRNDPVPLSQFDSVESFVFAMDSDWDDSTTCKIIADNENISVSSVTVPATDDREQLICTEIAIPLPATNTQEVIDFIGNRESGTGLTAELAGYSTDGKLSYLLQLKNFTIRNRLTSAGEPTELPETVADRAWVLALLRAGFEVEFRETSDGGTEFRLRSASAGGEWSDYVTLPRGEPGPAGADGVGSYLYVAYASDASGSGFSLTPSNDRKFRAEIHRTSELSSPSASDFAGAVWVKYLGDDGAGAGDMLKTVYDTDNDGVVDHAASADAVGETGAAAVSDAVQKSHTHTNSATLAKFGESNGRPTFSGAEIAGASSWEELTGKPESFPAASHTHALSEVNGLESALSGKLDASQRGAAGGVAELGSDGKVPLSQLPSGIGSGSGGSGQTLLHVPVPVDADNDALNLIVEFSSDAAFSTVAATLDTRTNRDGVYYFLGGQVGKYQPFPSGGVGLEAYRSDVLIDLAAAGIANTSFRRYRWHDGTVYTDWRGL